MRKVLLATSALVAGTAFTASAYAAAPELSLSGRMDYTFISESYDETSQGTNNFEGFAFDNGGTQIHFDVDAESDNGLAYGGRIDWRTSSNTIDEVWLDFKGSFGTIVLGQDDGAVDHTVPTGGSAHVGTGGYDGGFTAGASGKVGSAPNGTGGVTTSETSDDEKIVYFTPNFGGFSGALSYEFEDDNGGSSATYGNILEVAGKWSGDLGGANLTVAAGMGMADNNTATSEDLEAYEIGAVLDVAGFTIAGSLTDNGESGLTNANAAAGQDAGQSVSFGVGYSFGATSVSVGFLSSELSTSNSQEDSYENLSLDVNHTLAEGLNVFAGIQFAESDDGSAATSAESTAVVIGTALSF